MSGTPIHTVPNQQTTKAPTTGRRHCAGPTSEKQSQARSPHILPRCRLRPDSATRRSKRDLSGHMAEGVHVEEQPYEDTTLEPNGDISHEVV